MTVIAVVGSLNVDLVSVVSRNPAAGETITSESFVTRCGGKGANQAVAAARLAGKQASIEMTGAVGDDEFGTRLKTGLAGSGVHVDSVRTVNGMNSGVAVILVEKNTGENRIILSPGANASVLADTLSPRLFDPATRPDLLLLQLEIPLSTVLDIIRKASSCSPPIPVLFNPAPAVPLPDSIYPLIDILVVNESEASILSGVQFPDENTAEGLTALLIESKAFEAVTWFATKGAQDVVITLGAFGAVYYSSKHKSMKRVPAPSVQVVDTTAAGDTFIGALAVQRIMVLENSLEETVQYAVRAASWTVQRTGTWEAMPTWNDMASF